MCNMCEGTSFEEQLASLRQRLDQSGWTSTYVEPNERSLSWAYTMGMIRSGHPELVIVDEPMDVTDRIFSTLAPQVLAGTTFEAGATFEFDGRTWAVLPVHRSHVRAGMLGWWDVVVPHCTCHAEPPAIQLIDVDELRPPDDGGGLRLDRPWDRSSERQLPRAQRRRRERAEAKRLRRNR